MNQFIKSPNFSSREGQKVLAVCVHITDGDTRSVIQTFTNPKTQVSSHYLVCRNGDIIQFVEESQSAWGSGKKVNPTAKIVLERLGLNPNIFLIQVENECMSNQDLTEIQYVTSGKLLGEICLRHGIPLDQEHIIPHHSIRSDKLCPGIISISKLIGLAQSPPQISEISELKIKISLLQKILELMKSIMSFKKLGNIKNCELDQ